MIGFIFQPDKQKHFLICACIAMVVLGLHEVMVILNLITPLGNWLVWLLASLSALAVGIWKEWRDSRPGGTGWSWGDILADVLGAATGASFIFIK